MSLQSSNYYTEMGMGFKKWIEKVCLPSPLKLTDVMWTTMGNLYVDHAS